MTKNLLNIKSKDMHDEIQVIEEAGFGTTKQGTEYSLHIRNVKGRDIPWVIFEAKMGFSLNKFSMKEAEELYLTAQWSFDRNLHKLIRKSWAGILPAQLFFVY